MIEAKTKVFWRATLALSLGSFMVFANLYTAQPLLPMFAQEFNISPLVSNWALAISTLVLGISLLLFAPLSDVLGRRTLMRATLIGVTFSTIALVFVETFAQLVFFRALQGFFLAGLPAIAIAYMIDEFSQKALALAVGIYIAANSLGGVFGRLMSGFMATHYGWNFSFLAMAFLSLACLLFFFWALPASKNFQAGSDKLNISKMLEDLLAHLKNPALVLIYLMGGLNFFIFVNQYTYIAFRLSEAPYKLSAAYTGLLFLTYLTGTFSAFISGRLALKVKFYKIMLFGIFILFIGSTLSLSANMLIIVAGLFLNAFGFFLSHSIATAWVGKKAEKAKASASALYLVFYYLGASSGGFYLDIFWHLDKWRGVVLASYAILSVSLILVLLAKKYEIKS